MNDTVSTPEATLVLKPVWDNGFCTFEVLYPTSPSFNRHQIDVCAENAGYSRHGSIWTPPTGRSAFSDFSDSLSQIGVKVQIEYGPDAARFNLQRLKLETSTRTMLETLQNFELSVVE
ncbi:hypothetical protein [Agrobacterium vitis]|uniref:hypothetical protein n=1 Tax=Agrobacterium vitis TaxID=373 RepID=UPI003D2DAD10